MNNFLFFNPLMKVFFGASACFILATTSTFAQSVSDDELRQYAVVMDSIDAMKQNIQEEYNTLIQDEELMQGGRRFVEIQQVGDDSVRLSELNVTEMELETFNKIQEKYVEMTSEFKENYTNLIKEDLGAALYNKVSKAIKEDSEVKNKYDSILEEVKAEGNEETDESGQLTQPGDQDNTGLDQSGDLNESNDMTTPTETPTTPENPADPTSPTETPGQSPPTETPTETPTQSPT
ncbi:MAG: hypothetical protein ACR2KB_08650, partial [Chitinophagaceae bacterium]